MTSKLKDVQMNPFFKNKKISRNYKQWCNNTTNNLYLLLHQQQLTRINTVKTNNTRNEKKTNLITLKKTGTAKKS